MLCPDWLCTLGFFLLKGSTGSLPGATVLNFCPCCTCTRIKGVDRYAEERVPVRIWRNLTYNQLYGHERNVLRLRPPALVAYLLSVSNSACLCLSVCLSVSAINSALLISTYAALIHPTSFFFEILSRHFTIVTKRILPLWRG